LHQVWQPAPVEVDEDDEESVKNNFVLIYELIDGISLLFAYNSLVFTFA